MPIYEYQCSACDQLTETLQKVNDPPLTICPHCHQEALRRLVSQTQFKLKGTGWYVTDFKDKKTAEKPSQGQANKKESKAETTSETKTKEDKASQSGSEKTKKSEKAGQD